MMAKFRDQINAKARMMLVVPPTVVCPFLPLTPPQLSGHARRALRWPLGRCLPYTNQG